MLSSLKGEASRSALYQKNLRYLETNQPKMVGLLQFDEASLKSSVHFEITGKGHTHVTFGSTSDSRKPLHSKVNPQREAERFLSHAKISPLQNLILFGLGLGYHLFELLESKNKPPWILVIESDLRAFYAYLHLHDATLLFETRALHFMLRPSEEELFYFLQPQSFAVLANGLKIIRHQASNEVGRNAYNLLDVKITDFVKWANVNVSTQARVANLFSKNTIMNLKSITESRPLSVFKNKFSNIPAIIVAAGPSLAKNACLLEKASKRCLIFAVDTSLRVLDHYGVEPDFIVSTDFTKNTEGYFNLKEGTKRRSVLLVDPEVYPDVVSSYPGPILFSGIEGKSICDWLQQVTGDLGTLPKGLSVSHSAFSAATFLGAGPILLIGQDLAYTNGRTHVKGAAHGVELKAGKKMITVPGLFGPVQTSNSMKIFLDHYEEMISRSEVPVIDATEGGALIKGCAVKTFREALMDLDVLADLPLTRTHSILKNSNRVGRVSHLKPFIQKGIDDLKQLVVHCQELQGNVRGIQMTLHPSKIDVPVLKDQINCYQKNLRGTKIFEDMIDLLRDNMIEAYVLRAKRYPKKLDEMNLYDERDEAIQMLGNNLSYYLALEKAAKVVKIQLQESLEDLDASVLASKGNGTDDGY